MKLIEEAENKDIMIKHLTFTFFILLSLLGQSQELSKKWQFEHIRKTDDTTNLRVIEENDYMLINKDGSFEYEIKFFISKS